VSAAKCCVRAFPQFRREHGGTLTRCAFEACSTCRIAAGLRKRHTSRRRGNRAERGCRGAFLAVRSSGCEAARTFLAAWQMSLGVSSYAPRRRQEGDAETDFRRAAPAATGRSSTPRTNTSGGDHRFALVGAKRRGRSECALYFGDVL
jgi:hypothetical protein